MQKKLVHSLSLAFATSALLLVTGQAMAADASPLAPAVRLQLARSAAERAGLREVGLDFRDLYGVIHAESSWVARDGKGRNGVTSEGLAQFEPATAKAVGLRDPNNAVEAVNAAARLLREAAAWSAQRIAGLRLAPEQRAAKLREGVSIYYNLSSRARSTWSGLNTASLPVETQRHIRNVHEGAKLADRLNEKLGGASLPPLPAVALASVNASRTTSPAAKSHQAVGTIEWSGEGGAGPNQGRRSYVVLANGTVRPDTGNTAAVGIRFTPRKG